MGTQKMPLPSLPSEVLAQITSHLDTSSLRELSISGNGALSRKLAAEPCVRELRVKQELPLLWNLLTSVGAHLHRIYIGRLEKTVILHPTLGLFWGSTLPQTLEVIDFDFPSSGNMWLRPAVLGQDTWMFSTDRCGLTPVFLCELFPRLNTLRLTGAQDHTTWPAEALKLPFPTDLSSSTLLLDAWTNYQSQLWFKKLPHTLTSLTMPLGLLQSQIVPYLPPHITHLHNLNSSSGTQSRALEESTPLPEHFFANITSLDCPITNSALEAFLPKFACLNTLCLDKCDIQGSILAQLPRTLRNLSLYASSPFYTPISGISPDKHLRHLPAGLTALTMSYLTAPSLDDNISTYSPLLGFLPRALRELCLLRSWGTWNTTEHFANMATHLPHIEKFVFHTAHTIHVDSFDWVPVKTLRHLELGADQEVLDAMDELAMDDWLENGSDLELRTLIFGGTLGCNLTDNIAEKLPPKLTRLEIRRANRLSFRPDFLLRVPRSLTSLTIASVFEEDHKFTNYEWSDDVLLPMSEAFQPYDTRYFKNPDPERTPPNLHTLDVGIAIGGALLPKTMEVLNRKFFQEWIRRPGNEILRATHLLMYHLRSPLYFPSTLTEIDLDISIKMNSPIWKLPHLKTLSIRRFLTAADKTRPSMPSLQQLSLIDHFSEDDWLVPTVKFPNLTSLRFNAAACAFDKNPSRIGLLSRLTTLELSGAGARIENLVPQLTASLTSLLIPYLPDAPLENFQPKLRSLTVVSRCVSDAQLRQIGAELFTLSVPYVRVESCLELWKSLDRELQEISDLDLARVLCPRLTSFRKRYTTGWQFAVAERSSAAHEKMLAVLPPKLQTFRFPHFLTPASYRSLPTSLTSLTVDSETLWGRPLDLLPNLTQFTASTERTVTLRWFKALPRSLRQLTLLSLYVIPEGGIAALPPQLECLNLLYATLKGADMKGNLQNLLRLTLQGLTNVEDLLYLPSTLITLKIITINQGTPTDPSISLDEILSKLPPKLLAWPTPICTNDAKPWNEALERHIDVRSAAMM